MKNLDVEIPKELVNIIERARAENKVFSQILGEFFEEIKGRASPEDLEYLAQLEELFWALVKGLNIQTIADAFQIDPKYLLDFLKKQGFSANFLQDIQRKRR